MPDRWILTSATGSTYELNSTFSAPQYEAGGVDTSALRSHRASGSYQRAGDGLRTPGPLTLAGIVFRDDGDMNAIRVELEQIEAAVATCVKVERRTSRVRTTYEDLDGGPTIAMHPDGLGGVTVEVELWPRRAEPVVLPTVTPTTRIHLYIDGSGSMTGDIPALQQAVQILRSELDAEIYGGTASEYVTSSITPSGDAGERWLQFGAALPGDDVIAIVAVNEASSIYHATPRNVPGEPTSAYLVDYASWLSRIESTVRRRLVLYVVPHETLSERQAFAGHVNDAMNGVNGYPSGLPATGVETRMDVPTGATAEWFANDMRAVIF